MIGTNDSWGGFAQRRAEQLFSDSDKSYESLVSQFFLRLTPEEQRGKRILDIGCGVGRLSLDLVRNGANVIGVDPSMDSILEAREYVGNAEFIVGRISDLPNEETFEAAVAFMVLHCIEDLNIFMTEVHNRLLPKGKLWVVVPSPAWFVQHAGQLSEQSNRNHDGVIVRTLRRDVFISDGLSYGRGANYFDHGNNFQYYRYALEAGFSIKIFEDTMSTPLDGGIDFAFDAFRGDLGVESLPDMNLMCFEKP